MKKFKNIFTVALCGLLIFGFAIFAWVKAPHGYSVSERRVLAQLPQIKADRLISGRWMESFESYSMDQFPLRDGFRSFKAFVSKYVFLQKDNHGLYTVSGVLSKLEYPENISRLTINLKKINEIEKKYLKDTECKVYLSVIPDKNYFMAPVGAYPSMDYDEFEKTVKESVSYDGYIDIKDLLSLDDYYNTDQHWRQEKILDIAKRISAAMRNNTENISYTENVLDYPFKGAYVGQYALPFDADTIKYLTNDELSSLVVTSYNTGSPQEGYVYDMSKAYGRDPYEIFLGGNDPLIVIENPNAHSGKELVVFRDSFGSALVPLLVSGYEKITLVDLRYIRSNMLADYISFDKQDVLFIYSTLVLNNTLSM